jgi:hypothetical protein
MMHVRLVGEAGGGASGGAGAGGQGGAGEVGRERVRGRRGGDDGPGERAGRKGRAKGPDDGLVAEFAATAGYEVVQLGADGVVQWRRLERLELGPPDIAGPGGGVLAA